MSFKPAATFSRSSAIQLQLIKHQRMLRIILAVSPKQLRAYIKDCVINNNSLMIYVSSPAWASRLRFCTAQIQQAVNVQSNERINKIRIRTLRPEPFKMHKEVQKIIPSAENIEMLRDNTNHLAEGKLKDALLGLSKALKKHSR